MTMVRAVQLQLHGDKEERTECHKRVLSFLAAVGQSRYGWMGRSGNRSFSVEVRTNTTHLSVTKVATDLYGSFHKGIGTPKSETVCRNATTTTPVSCAVHVAMLWC